MLKFFNSKSDERGNVFFTLFGAVAVVGVLGAGIMATMRGPLSTMVQVNRKTTAESQMEIAAKVIVLQSADQANAGDCDSDGFIEPLPFKAGTGPTSGGIIPDDVGVTKLDPWGTAYGYCVWDAGPLIDTGACNGENRIAGSGSDALSSDSAYSVIALISAGPDRIFNSPCLTFAAADTNNDNIINNNERMVTATGDDIVLEKSYDDSRGLGGGLWKLKLTDANVAEIDKNLEIQGNIDLNQAGAGTGQLILSSSSLLLPTDSDLGTCDNANNLLLRINTGDTPPTLQICDGATDTWFYVDDGDPTAQWLMNGTNELYYNTANVGIGNTDPAFTLDVTGTFNVSTTAAIGTNATIGGTLGVTGDATFSSNVNLTGTDSVVWDGGARIQPNGANLLQIGPEVGIGTAAVSQYPYRSGSFARFGRSG